MVKHFQIIETRPLTIWELEVIIITDQDTDSFPYWLWAYLQTWREGIDRPGE